MDSSHNDEIRDDAREVARDVLDWRATEAEWAEIAELVEAAVQAAEFGDDAALRAGTLALELAGPLRITRLDEGRKGQVRRRNPCANA